MEAVRNLWQVDLSVKCQIRSLGISGEPGQVAKVPIFTSEVQPPAVEGDGPIDIGHRELDMNRHYALQWPEVGDR
jgi:hypothetical protein